MPEVKISVVMAVYNAEKYLSMAIESILNQTFKDFEFVIVNDGSNDRSLEIIKSFNDQRIVLINQKNAGVAAASNRGIKESKGEFIARLDSDDLSLPIRLEKQYYFLKTNQDYIAVGSNADIIDADNNFLYCSNQKITNESIKSILPNSPFINSSVMFKKDIFFKIGQYCENLSLGEDRVLFNRMAPYGKFYNFQECLIKYRILPTSISMRKTIGERFSKIIKHAIKSNTLSNEDRLYLKSLIDDRSLADRLSIYHLHLAKKNLWSNYKPKNARYNIIKSLKKKIKIFPILLYIVSFFPEKTIARMYKIIKFKKWFS